MKKIFFTIIILNLLFSQVITDNTFNNSRSISLSGATISNPNDSFNPANLQQTNGTSILVGRTMFYEQDFLEFQYYSLRRNNFAITFQELGTKTKSSTSSLSTEKAIMFSHGITLLKDRNSSLRIGYNLNYLFLKQGASAGVSGDGSNGISGKKIDTAGFDIGLFASLRGKITIAAFVKNINSPKIGRGSNAQYLPRHLKIGFSYLPSPQLITTFNYERLLGSKTNQFRFGIEYNLHKYIILRAGVQMKPNRFGFGFSSNINDNISASYGMITHQVLPITHNFELGFNLK